MSSSDDHRHRLRTATKYFKVSHQAFSKACRVWGNAPREKAWQGAGRQPRDEKNQLSETLFNSDSLCKYAIISPKPTIEL